MLAGALALAGCAWARGAANAPAAGDILPRSGPLRAATMGRLLLVDAVRIGNRIVAVGDRGYVVVSEDHGVHWARAVAPDAPLLTALEFTDAKHGWAVGHDEVIIATVDGGHTWTEQFRAPAEKRPLLDVTFVSHEAGIAVGAYGAYYETSDAGKHWSARKIIPDDRHLNAIVRIGEGRLLIVGEAGTLLASDDAGRTWTPLASPYKGSLFGALVAADGAVVAFGLRGHIYRSTDGARTWTQVANPSAASLMGGTRFPDGGIVLAGAAGVALVSRDDGRSFVSLATGTTSLLAKAVMAGPDAVLLFGEAGAREVPFPSQER